MFDFASAEKLSMFKLKTVKTVKITFIMTPFLNLFVERLSLGKFNAESE